jgi:peptide/nickel transport system substrate-binding protein
VAYTYNALLDRQNNYPLRNRLDGVAQVKTVDKDTVQIVLEGPLPDFLANLADFNLFIMPKHLRDRGEDLDKVAIGTGPMKLKTYDRQTGATWVKNAGYWREGQPHADGMQFHLLADPATRTAAFIAGKADIRAPTDKAQVDDLRLRVPNIRVAATPTDYGNSLVMKLDRPPFNDKRVRRAIHLATDRQALVEVAAFGEGTISMPGMPGNKTGWALPREEWVKLPGFRQPKNQDLVEAKRLMTEAGYPNGIKVKVLFPSSKSATPKIAEPFVSQLGVTGLFDLTLDGRPQTDVVRFTQEGNFEALFDGVANMSLNTQRNYLHSKGVYNKYGLNDPRIDDALDTISRSTDLNKRKAAAQEMQRVFLEENYIIPTIDLPGYQVWHPWLKNYRYNRGIAEIIDARAIAELWMDVDQVPSDRRTVQ